eukprot:3421750-Pleurochrysis_carterae.AAC.2
MGTLTDGALSMGTPLAGAGVSAAPLSGESQSGWGGDGGRDGAGQTSRSKNGKHSPTGCAALRRRVISCLGCARARMMSKNESTRALVAGSDFAKGQQELPPDGENIGHL